MQCYTLQTMEEKRPLAQIVGPITYKKGILFNIYQATLSNGAVVKAYRNRITHKKSVNMKYKGITTSVNKDCYHTLENIYNHNKVIVL